MNAKEINPLERHVEKIVLAVAALGALYMGYLALQPVTVNMDGDQVPAGQIETKLSEYIDRMDRTVQDESKKNLDFKLTDFVKKYQDLIRNQPLDPKLLVANAVPSFGPAHASLGGVVDPGGGGPTQRYQIVTPTPVPPEFLS